MYPTYSIDELILREVLDDVNATIKWCQNNNDNPEVVSYLRMVGELDSAKQKGIEFVNSSQNTPTKINALLRLATVHHWLVEFEESEAIYQECLALCQRNDFFVNEAFAHQHISKLYIDMNRIEQAKEHANEALRLRQKYDVTRVDSTRLVLSYLNENY